MPHSQHSKIKKELAGLQPANYSYGRRIPKEVITDDNWKFPELPNVICAPCNSAENVIDECNCSVVDNVDNDILNVSIDQSLDTTFAIDDNETAIFNALPQDDSSVEDLLSIDDDSIVETPPIQNCDGKQTVIEENLEMKDMEYKYQTLNELGNKIISFPELKSRIEENFVWK